MPPAPETNQFLISITVRFARPRAGWILRYIPFLCLAPPLDDLRSIRAVEGTSGAAEEWTAGGRPLVCCVHSSVEGHLACLQSGVVMNEALVYKSLWGHTFSFL